MMFMMMMMILSVMLMFSVLGHLVLNNLPLVLQSLPRTKT